MTFRRGQGAIVRRGLKKLAVYKRKDGSTCEMSATCRHLGAVVRWNPGEQTWDCPAHGSRYSCEGEGHPRPGRRGLEAGGGRVEVGGCREVEHRVIWLPLHGAAAHA